jgi:ribonuclease-3
MKLSEKAIEERRLQQLHAFMQALGISFHNLDLLDRALTHSSYANENQSHFGQHNERLEFLGDAILDFAVGEYLFLHFPDMPEGELSKARASVVSETPLAECSASFELGQYLRMGHGEVLSGGRSRASILADAFEAIVGAIYLDSSYDEARRFILSHLQPYLDKVSHGDYGKDYKTIFQEFIHPLSRRRTGSRQDILYGSHCQWYGIGQGVGKDKKRCRTACCSAGFAESTSFVLSMKYI